MLTTKKSLIIIVVSIFATGTVLSPSFLFFNDSLIENIDYTQIYYQHVFGQVNADQTSANSSSAVTTKDNLDSPFYREGIILSSKSGPNETSQVALLLPHRADGMIYSGVLTYTASSSVEIAFLSGATVDSATLSQIIDRFGESSPNWIDFASSIHNLTESTTQII